MNADGSGQRRLTRSTVRDSDPVWSPDGRRIAFESNWQLYVMNADGSGTAKADAQRGAQLRSCLVARRAEDRVRAPVGRRQRDPCSGCGGASTFEIYVMNADGSGQQRLTHRRIAASLVTGRAKDRVRERARRQRRHLRHERRRQRTAEPDASRGSSRKRACLVARAETVTVTAPPRPPRPSDPVDREELEALVEALIEEARQRARRRRRIYAASVALVALVGVAVSAVLQRSTQPDTASPALAARSGLPAGTTSSKLAFISHKSYACCGRGGPFLLYVMNADGSGKRLLTRDAWGGLAWSPDGRKIAFVGAPTRDRQERDLRHQRRRQREAETDAQRGVRLRSCLVARWAEDRLQPRPERAPAGVRHERRRERTAAADAAPRRTTRILPGCPTGRSPL